MRIAAIQMVSGQNVTQNLRLTEQWLSQAAQQGAQVCVLPENFACMGEQDADQWAIGEIPGQGQIQDCLAEQAAKYQMWLIGGTVPLRVETAQKVRSACLVFNDKGEPVARYDKIHLFDVEVATGEAYRESEHIQAGDTPVLVETPWGKLGLAICYDLRFPELFRYLMQQGMTWMAIPAAFTAATGKAHWEMLLRARAVENLSFVVAANQGGKHPNGRSTYGDSLICDPWGQVLQRLPQGNGVVCADLDFDEQRNIRSRFPCLEHQRIHIPMGGEA